MRVKEGYMLREIAGTWIVVPIGARVVEFNGLISLTETSALIWQMIEDGAKKEEILNRILTEYDVDKETAMKDLDGFIDQAIEKGLIEL